LGVPVRRLLAAGKTGNMTRRDPPGTDYYDFVYDAEDQLTQAKKNGAVIATFTYDGDGRRVKSVIGSATTVFVGVTTK
jgi:YD repeat-containing protein